MNEDELRAFYAGCALIGIMARGGGIEQSVAFAAHDMAFYMIEAGKKIKEIEEKRNVND